MSEFTNIFKDGEVTGYNPDINGDYYKVTDMQLDYNYWAAKLVEVITALSTNNTESYFILYGGVVSDSGGGQVDISAGVGFGYDDSGNIRLITIPALTNIDLPAGWKDDRQVWIVGEYASKYGAVTRAHRATAEVYHYTTEDSYLGETDSDDLFVDADPNNPAETIVCWGSFQMSAGNVFTDLSAAERTRMFILATDVDCDTVDAATVNATTGNITTVAATTVGATTVNSGDVNATGDVDVTGTVITDALEEKTTDNGVNFNSMQVIGDTYHVFTQAQFNSLITRVGALQYKISDGIRCLVLHYLSGGYLLSGMLSGGDAYGYLETNQCASITCEGGAFIGVANERGYIKVNTEGCTLNNVHVKGTGGAAAIVQSFLLAENYVTFNNCKTSARNSSVDFVGFQGSGTALHNTTGKYRDCSVYAIDGSDKIYGFKDCKNLSNCLVYDLSGTTDEVYGFNTCYSVLNCNVDTLTSTTGIIYGMRLCYNISNCRIENLTSTNGNVVGILSNYLSNCCVSNLTSGSTSYAYGFTNCSCVVCCVADTIAGGAGVGGVGGGFNACSPISGCLSQAITGTTNEGFKSCSYGAALYTNEAANSGNDFMDTTDANITNKFSTMATAWT